MAKVSVILPVYGVAQYIEKCTQSLLAQTLDDIEFIFVDDHGPDNSIELVQKLVENHPRKEQFKFLKPEHNVGAGMARNYAIPHAVGEYIAFVDSDDWIEPTMFEDLYNEGKKNNSDLCYCQAYMDFSDEKPSKILKNPDVETGEMTHEKRAYFLTNYVSLFWTFIFKRDLILDNDICYPEDRSADDSYFISCALMVAKSISHVDKPFYHYLIRSGSVCTTKDSTKYQKRLIVFDKLLQYAKKHSIYQEFQSEIDFVYLKKGYFSSIFNYVNNSTEPKITTINEIYDELVKQVPNYKENAYYRKKYSLRILVYLLRHQPKLAIKLISKYIKKTNMVG